MANACRPLKSAADFTRGGGPPTPDHDADNACRASRVEAEQQRLIQWAQSNDKISFSGRLPPAMAQGGEHQVFFHKRKQRYIKSTLPNRQRGYGIALGSYTHGATPSEYLDRLDLQNLVFNDDIQLELIEANNGKPIIIISQPFIKGDLCAPTKIDELMIGKGYEKLTDGAYYDAQAGLLMFDLFPRNVIQTAGGDIYPIDPVIQRIAADFGQFLREQPYTINNPH